MVAPKVNSASVVNGTTVDVAFDQAMKQDVTFFNAANYQVLPGHTVSAVAAPSTSVARLTITPELLTGDNLTASVNAALQNAIGESMNVSFLSAAFTGIGDAPSVASALALNDTTVRVTFNEPMQNTAALNDVASYVITPPLGAVPATVINVTPEGVTNPSYVDLTLAAELTDGALYQVTVASTLLDAVGNVINPAGRTTTFTGSGTEPQVTGLQFRDNNATCRVFFSEPMRRDGALESVSNYAFTVLTVGAAQIFVSAVTLPPGNPQYVDLSISEMTDGANYELSVSTLGPTDVALNNVDGAANTQPFVGVGEAPTVSQVIGVGRNRADVVFSETMRDNADIREASRYTWDNGLVTLNVLDVQGDTVQLVTSDQVEGVLYTLTIDPT